MFICNLIVHENVKNINTIHFRAMNNASESEEQHINDWAQLMHCHLKVNLLYWHASSSTNSFNGSLDLLTFIFI